MPRRHADVDVLGPLRQPRPFRGGQVGAGEVDQRGEGRALHRGRRGQAGADRDACSRGDVGRDADAAVAQHGDDAGDVAGPPVDALGRSIGDTGRSPGAARPERIPDVVVAGATATTVRCDNANGSTKPSL